MCACSASRIEIYVVVTPISRDHTAIVSKNGKSDGYAPKKNGRVNDLPLFNEIPAQET